MAAAMLEVVLGGRWRAQISAVLAEPDSRKRMPVERPETPQPRMIECMGWWRRKA
jgi:hypothetical protein